MIRNKIRWGGKVLVATAAGTLLVAAACGGDDSDSDGGDSALSPFCQEFNLFEDKWGDLDPEAFFSGELGDEADQVISDLRSLDPPDEIAEEWPTFVDTIEAGIGDPEGAASDPDITENQQALQSVQAHVSQECVEPETGAGTE